MEEQYVYHYTTLTALKSIVKNKTLRLTDYKNLNDESEINYGVDAVQNMLMEEKSANGSTDVVKKLSDLLSYIRNNQYIYYTGDVHLGGNKWASMPHVSNTRLYMLSTTTSENSTYMWEHYAPEGCRIKLKSNELFNYVNNLYISHKLIKFIGLISGHLEYGNIEKLFFDLKRYTLLEGQDFYLNAFNTFYQLCALHKASKYSPEKEFRIGFVFFDEWFDNKGYAYNWTQNAIIKRVINENAHRKKQIELLHFPVDKIFEDIVLSSQIRSTATIKELKQFLNNEAQLDIPIF